MAGNQTSAYIGSLSLLGVITIPPAVTFLLPLIVYTNVVEKNAGLLEMCKIVSFDADEFKGKINSNPFVCHEYRKECTLVLIGLLASLSTCFSIL
jgi:hypothetical protein